MLLDLDAIFDPDRVPRPRPSSAEPNHCPACGGVVCGRAKPIASPADLPSEWFLVWDERAAIMEFDGEMPRERAEHFALLDVMEQMKRVGCSIPADNYRGAL